jgi:hypothetical protein
LPAGIRVGWGLVAGTALGVVFMPMFGAAAIAIGAGIGVVFGAALEGMARHH